MSNTLPTTVVCPCCSKAMKVTKSGKISAHKHPRIPGNRGSAPGSNLSVDPAKTAASLASLALSQRCEMNSRRPNRDKIEAIEKAVAWISSL